MKNFLKYFVNITLVNILLFILVAPVVQATNTYNFYMTVSVTENSGIARTNLAIATGINITNLISTGYLNAQASNNAFVAGGPNGNTVPYMLKNDNLYFYVDTLAAFQTKSYYLLLQNSPNQTQYQIVIGNNGTQNITVTGNASLVLGNNFSATYSGYVDATQNNSFWNQQNSFSWNTSSNGSLSFNWGGSFNNTISSYNTSGASSSNTTTPTFNISTTGLSFGDLILLEISGGNVTYSFPAGWVKLASKQYTQYVGLDVWYYRVTGGEAPNVTANASSSTSYAYISYRIANAKNPQISTIATGTSANPAPPSLNSTYGNITTMWIPMVSAERGGTYTVNSYPAGFGNTTFITTGLGTPNPPGMASCNLTDTNNSSSPGTYTLSIGCEWLAATVAVAYDANPGISSVIYNGFTSGNKTLTANISSGNITLWIDGISVATNNFTAVFTSLNNITLMKNMSYATNISLSINNTLVMRFSPNATITGTYLPDLSGKGNSGVINFGVNPSGIIITIGAITPSLSLTPSATFSSQTNAIQNITIPSNWYGYGAVPHNVPFYSTFNSAATDMGMKTDTLYFMLFMGIVSAVALGVASFTGSTLLVIAAMLMFMGSGVGFGLISGWMVFFTLIGTGSIWYLSRRG